MVPESPLLPVAKSGVLSRRERQVLEAYAVYWSWKAVGAVLAISPRTARHHGEAACRRLGVERIGQAILIVNARSHR